MAKAISQKRAKLSVSLPPPPTKVEFIGPYDEAYCFLYRALGGGFFNYEFKPQTDVTEQEWNDPSITIYKMAAQYQAVIRHQKLDNGLGSVEIFQAPGSESPILRTPRKRPCEGPCPEYTIEDCPLNTYPVCIDGELHCQSHAIPPDSQKGPAGHKGKPTKNRRAAN